MASSVYLVHILLCQEILEPTAANVVSLFSFSDNGVWWIHSTRVLCSSVSLRLRKGERGNRFWITFAAVLHDVLASGGSVLRKTQVLLHKGSGYVWGLVLISFECQVRVIYRIKERAFYLMYSGWSAHSSQDLPLLPPFCILSCESWDCWPLTCSSAYSVVLSRQLHFTWEVSVLFLSMAPFFFWFILHTL